MQENKLIIWKLNINYKVFWELKKGNNNIVILHGWWGSSDSWIRVWELLNSIGYNIIVPDLPGFWKTKLNNALTLDDYAIIVENFINELSVIWKEWIILWWHSNGWGISIKISNRKKIKISTLILNNSAGIRNDRKRSLKRKALNLLSKSIKKIIPKNIKLSKFRTLFYKLIGGQDYLESEKDPKLKQTYLNIIWSDLKEEIKNIKNNTLLIWWEKDSYTPYHDGMYMRQNIKKSKMIVLKDQKHWIHLQAPEKLVEAFIHNI
jgi:pimeloyl-ACP methyl ester carboxylesterase